MKIKDILGFALGPITGAALGIIILPITAWVFTPEDIGRLNMLNIIISFSLLLLVLGLDQAYIREFHQSTNRASLLRACFAPGFLLLCFGVLVTFAFYDTLSYLLFHEKNLLFYMIMVFCIIATYLSRFLSLILRMQERGFAYSMSEVIPKALQLLMLIAVMSVNVRRDFLTMLIITAISTLTVVIVYAWNTRQQWRPALVARTNLIQTRTLLRFGLPLAFSGLAYWGLTATSSIILRSQSSLGELGVYSVTSSIAGVAAIFQSIFTVVWAPMVYKWVSQDGDMTRVDAIARQALAVVCGIFVLVGIFSWVIEYILPAHYSNIRYTVLCAIAPPLLYTLSEITCIGIAISRRTELSVWVTLVALLTNVVLNLWLVPKHGAAGAIISNAVAYLIFFVTRTEASAYIWRQFPRRKLYTCMILFTCLAVAMVVFGPTIPFNTNLIWLTSVPLLGYGFRTEWLEMLAKIRNYVESRTNKTSFD